MHSNRAEEKFSTAHKKAAFTLTGCNTTPSIPFAYAVGNTFFKI